MARQDTTLSPSEISIHLNDGDGQPLRCCNVIALNGTGESAVTCGVVAAFVCEDCGPFCSACWQDTRCFSPDHQHRPISQVVGNTTDVLTAILAHRITPTYGLSLLRSFNAPAWMVERVQAIEADADLGFHLPKVSPLRRIACVSAAAELDKPRKGISAAAWF